MKKASKPSKSPTTAADLIAERVNAQKDPALHVEGAPAGYLLRGASTLVDADGRKIVQWVKTTREAARAADVLQAFRDAVAFKPLPKRARVAPPKNTFDDLLVGYPMGDPHFGMQAWPDETDNDFNLKIAREQLTEATDRLVALAPPSKRAFIVNLGDMLHADSNAATTTQGTRVDVDTRWPKMAQVAVDTLCRCVERALEKHEQVDMINLRGNHDDLSATVLAMCMSAYFKDNPRVRVYDKPRMFHFLEFGRNLLGFTHGHTVKAKELPSVMSTDEPAAWGRTAHRYWYTGHIHHETRKEFPGCVVETFGTLAGKDAWHFGQGYRARRRMVMDVIERNRGRIERHEIDVSDLDSSAAQ